MAHEARWTRLDRGLIFVEGPDALAFLDEMVPSDLKPLQRGEGVWSALLSAQGKYLHEFFLTTIGERVVLDCAAEQVMVLGRTLRRYRMSRQVSLGLVRDWAVVQMWDGAQLPKSEQAVCVADPRSKALGARMVGPEAAVLALAQDLGTAAPGSTYHALRYQHGLPEHAEMVTHKTLLLEAGFEDLGLIDWQKGCYLGQELTARTHYRGLVRKRFLPLHGSEHGGVSIEPGCVLSVAGQEVGEVRGWQDNVGLGFVRLDRLAGADSVVADGQTLTVARPSWMRLEETG